jgi:hypothetical protein
MKKLPEQVLRVNENGEVVGTMLAAFSSEMVKQFKVRDFKNEDGEVVKTGVDVVRDLFKQHLNDDEGNFELPDEWSAYAKLSDAVKELVAEHVKALASQKEKQKNEKELAAQEKIAKKEEKEKEDKAYEENQDSFASHILALKDKTDKKAAELFGNTIKGISLPKSISFSDGDMGLVISENATKDDIAVATANIFGGLEGVSNAAAALQFAVGDIINKSIERKIFRTKNDANEAISLVIKEKMHKSYAPGALNFYALMSERVEPSKRKAGIAPSIYLAASKIVAPRIKEGSREANEKLAKEFDGLREDTINKIANGDISSIKEVMEVVTKFKTANNLIGGETISVPQTLNTLFRAIWIDRNLEHENETYTFFKSKNSKEVFTITREELTSTIESCMNTLQNILMAKDNVPAILAGKIVKGKGDSTEEQDFFMVDPFGQFTDWTPEPKAAAPKKEEAPKETPKKK